MSHSDTDGTGTAVQSTTPKRKRRAVVKVPRGMAVRVRRCKQLQEELLLHAASIAQVRITYGMELLALKGRIQERGQSWVNFYRDNLETPKFKYRSTARYMQVAAAWRSDKDSPELLPPSEMTQEQRDEFARSVALVTSASTWEELQADLGLRPVDHEIKIGGNPLLAMWLAEHHPDIRATTPEDLPDELQEEFAKWQHIYLAENAIASRVSRAMTFTKGLDKLDTSLHRGHLRDCDPTVLERLAERLNDMRNTVIAQLRAQAENNPDRI